MKLIQYLLFPLSLVYQIILRFRNYLYDTGVFGVSSFDIPTINVGNLAFGGTGKTPHTEYLINLLKNRYRLGFLSRGYKRKTVGYVFADDKASPSIIGDEPFQIFNKFKEIAVAVSENRVLGIPNLLFDAPETEVILLDDAYQHRALKPGLNILLTEQKQLYTDDFLVPAGYLREYASAANRADLIVVSKCEPGLSASAQEAIIKKLNPLPHQKVFFSGIQYGELVPFGKSVNYSKQAGVVAFAGIANPSPFETYVRSQFTEVNFKAFPDHHYISETEYQDLLTRFHALVQTEKILLTTEKDYQKLLESPWAEDLKQYPFYYLPIEVYFLAGYGDTFDAEIYRYVQQN